MKRTLLIAIIGLGAAGRLPAQSLADRIRSVDNGEVRLSFTAREGICGDGRTYIRDQNHDNYYGQWNGGRDRYRPCEEGPVRIALRFTDGSIRSVRTYVGGDWSYQRPPTGPVRDLDQVPAPAAASALLALARRSRLGE